MSKHKLIIISATFVVVIVFVVILLSCSFHYLYEWDYNSDSGIKESSSIVLINTIYQKLTGNYEALILCSTKCSDINTLKYKDIILQDLKKLENYDNISKIQIMRVGNIGDYIVTTWGNDVHHNYLYGPINISNNQPRPQLVKCSLDRIHPGPNIQQKK